MATDKSETGNTRRELKRLGFVRVAAIQALVCISSLYDNAKRSSGPLRSAVGTVESTVATVVGPVYDKLKGVPDDLLSFLDNKVDEATNQFDQHAPPLAKQVVSQVHGFVLLAAEKAKKFVNEAQTAGLRAAFNYAMKESKQAAIEQTVNLWVVLNRYPAIHPLAEKAMPTVGHWSEKYNHVVVSLTQKGYTVVGFLPLIPVDEIVKAMKQDKPDKKEDYPASPSHKSGSDSDSN